jgi:hypothetical protein
MGAGVARDALAKATDEFGKAKADSGLEQLGEAAGELPGAKLDAAEKKKKLADAAAWAYAAAVRAEESREIAEKAKKERAGKSAGKSGGAGRRRTGMAASSKTQCSICAGRQRREMDPCVNAGDLGAAMRLLAAFPISGGLAGCPLAFCAGGAKGIKGSIVQVHGDQACIVLDWLRLGKKIKEPVASAVKSGDFRIALLMGMMAQLWLGNARLP